ncbi:MAG TPA: type II secretion system protein GspN [Kofleriaceae bacterium]|jgi:type II secretion system protein N
MMSVFANLGRNLGPRARRVLRYLGFAVLGLVAFVFALQLTFPFDRIKDKAIDALSEKYEVAIGDVERSIIPGRVYFKAVSLRTRPTKVGDVATTFYIERLGIDVGLFALAHGTIAVKLDAKIGAGHITGKIALANDGTVVKLDGDDLPSANLPMREVLGLPMSGKVRFALDLALPNDRKTGKPNAAKADGNFEFACPSGCTVGDGKSKLKLTTNNARQQAFLDEGGGGIDFGKVNIDSLFANVEIKSGKLDITRFETRSPDGELHVALDMALNQDLQASVVTGCLRFKGSDVLLKREAKTHAAISTTGAPLGPDNLFHIKLDGPIRQMRRLGVVCGPGAGGTDGSGSPPARPNLTITPEAPKPVPMTPPTQVPQPMPPAAQPPMPTGDGAGSEAHVQPPMPVGEGPPPVVMPSPGPPQAAQPAPPPAAPPPVAPGSAMQPSPNPNAPAPQ